MNQSSTFYCTSSLANIQRVYPSDPPLSTDVSLISLLSREPSALLGNTQPTLLLSRQMRNYNPMPVHSHHKKQLLAALEEAIHLTREHL